MGLHTPTYPLLVYTGLRLLKNNIKLFKKVKMGEIHIGGTFP